MESGTDYPPGVVMPGEMSGNGTQWRLRELERRVADLKKKETP